MTKKYKDREWLRQQYVDKERSTYDMANDVSVSQETVRRYLEQHGIERREKHIELPDTPNVSDKRIERLYHGEKFSTKQVAEKLDCSHEYVRVRLHKMDKDLRDQELHKLIEPVYYRTRKDGYEYWQVGIKGEKHSVPVHRLIAYCEHGLDAIKDKVIHHKNRIPWDNRIENLEPMTASEHSKHHAEEENNAYGDSGA